jgi:hypothetical protein
MMNKPKTKTKAVKDSRIKAFSAAFTEWERRYREDTDRFMSEGKKLLKETPKTYGDACAPYFVQILGEQTKKR